MCKLDFRKTRKKTTEKYSYSMGLFIGLIIILGSLISGVEGIFYIYMFYLGLILSYYILKDTEYCKFIFLFLISFFLSSCLVIVISGIFSLLSIPISVFVLVIPMLFATTLLFWKPIDINKITFRITISEGFLLLFLILSFIVYILSVLQYKVPILHDPIAHATWAKEIYNTGRINFFYSPGLHILVALGMFVNPETSAATYVLFLTNIFGGLTFVTVYLFIKEYFKKNLFALITATIFLTALYPFKFIWSAGKNSLVISTPVIFLVLFFSSLDIKKVSKIITVNFLVFALVLIHYPAAFIALIGVLFILLYKDGIKGLIYSLPGCLLGVAWGFSKLGYELARNEQLVSSPSKHAMDFTFSNVLVFFRDLYRHVLYGYFDFNFGLVILLLGIIGLVIMVLLSIKKKKYFWFTLFFLTNLLSMLIIKSIEALRVIGIVYLTQTLTLFLFIYIGAGFLLSEVLLPYVFNIKKMFKIFLYIVIVPLSIFTSYKGFLTYRSRQESLNMVNSNDIEMFKWMDDNLEKDVVILNNAARSERVSIIGVTDGGGWIPVFTDYSIAMPFTEFSLVKTHNIYEVYMRIFNSDYSCDDIEYLLERNIKYYYKAHRGVWGFQLNPSVDNKNFELVYESDDAKLYKILPCGLQ